MDGINKTTGRQYNYDLLRILCAFMVILLHTNAKYFSVRVESGNIEGIAYIVEQFINIIARFSVPCFAMLSGAFLLNQSSNRNFKAFYKKSAINVFLPYFVFAFVWLVYYFYYFVIVGRDFRSFVKTVIIGGYGDYWYMTMLVFLYLSVPLVIRIKENTTDKQFAIIGIVLLIWAMITQRSTVYTLPYASGMVMSYMSYFILGNVLHNIEVKNKKTNNIVTIMLLFLVIGIAMWDRLNGEVYYIFSLFSSFFYPPVVLMSLLVFWLFHNLTVNINIEKIAKYSFYIYLLQRMVITIIVIFLGVNFSNNELVSLFCFTLMVFVGSLAGAMISKQIIDKIRKCMLVKDKEV